jgi:hypothetical protein
MTARAILAACIALFAATPVAAQDWCAFLAKQAPAVFGTPLQARPQCDGPSAAANNRTGSDRLELIVQSVPGAELAVDALRHDTRESLHVTDEPTLGRYAVIDRDANGKDATFHVADGDRYILVHVRARDGLNDAYVERVRQFVKTLKSAKAP